MNTDPMFPDDEIGRLLQRMQAAGDNLHEPREIDFLFGFPWEDAANAFAREATEDALLQARVYRCEELGEWMACISKFMIPQHRPLMNLELHLLQVASRHGGDFDGWACLPVSHASPA